MQTNDLMPHLPYLRRHARMLAGSSQIGDDYVRLCLELLVDEPRLLQGDDARLLLYKAFHHMWNTVAKKLEHLANEAPQSDIVTFEPLLRNLASFERRAVLLANVEGFATGEIAFILGVSNARIEASLQDAAASGSDREGKDVLIIEDDPIIAEDIADLLRSMGFKIIGPAGNEKQAAALFESHSPGLILSDVQLEDDDSGVAATWRILKDSNVPVIFITGFPEAILTGEGAEPAFVLTKPFSPSSLSSTIDQVLDIYARPELAKQHGHYLFAHLDKIMNMQALAELMEHDKPKAARVAD